MPLIVIEGIDGSGSTYHSHRLVGRLKEEGRAALWRCAPTQGPFGKMVRSVYEGRFEGVPSLPNWRTMLYLFQADAEHHLEELREQLRHGWWVVSDRYWMSSLTYQVQLAMDAGEDQDVAVKLISEMNVHMPTADATFVLDVSVEEGLRRKNKDPDFFEKKDFLEKVRKLYLEIRGPSVRHLSTESGTMDGVHETIWKTLGEMGL